MHPREYKIAARAAISRVKSAWAQAADLPYVRRQRAQRVLRTSLPPSISLTFCRFGLNVRFVARWENDRLWPKVVVLPQFMHFAIYNFLSERMIPKHGIVPYAATFHKPDC